uniref:Myb/SANT-like domain-containing protein n=1 Tax=Setaria viridis TaxID=4556 RepID=A0A4U6TSD5_SETVI|nr:uncharacterized protein LOC117864330 [Setaria viridis]TKW03639.1 hypothetical protein SEVIR_7G053600v2 [Setaria viridis]
MGDKATWGDAFLRHLIDGCKEKIEAGNRSMEIFTTTGWKNVIFKFAEKSGDRRTKKTIEEQVRYSEKGVFNVYGVQELCHWSWMGRGKINYRLLRRWWNGHLTRCNNRDKGIKCNHVKFQKQGPKFLDDLRILFGKAHVSASSASYPGDISSNEASDEDVDEIPQPTQKDKIVNLGKRKRKGTSIGVEEKDEKSPFFHLYKNTCSKIETATERISTSVEASSASPTNLVPTVGETMKMVKECGVQEETALMYTAASLIVKPKFRELFSSLETTKAL